MQQVDTARPEVASHCRHDFHKVFCCNAHKQHWQNDYFPEDFHFYDWDILL
jgi:hypothetical protein